MVDVQVRIVAHLCGKTGAVSVDACSTADLPKQGALVLPRALMHFMKIERNSVPIADGTESRCARLLLDLVGRDVPSNWGVENRAKYKNHEWVGGGWEPVPQGRFGFAYPLLERVPGDVPTYIPIVAESKVDSKVLTVEYLAVVQKA